MTIKVEMKEEMAKLKNRLREAIEMFELNTGGVVFDITVSHKQDGSLLDIDLIIKFMRCEIDTIGLEEAE